MGPEALLGDPTRDLPYSLGPPQATGILRSIPEHFIVEERLSFAPSGRGEHYLVLLEKIDANTEWVARQLARRLGIRSVDVGYAGLKDRRARTRQWFSVRWPRSDAPAWDALPIDGVSVLEVHPHDRKLRRGALDSNRFTIVVSEFEGDVPELEQRLTGIASNGVPNYFGPQRFGRQGSNVRDGIALLTQAEGQTDRYLRGIYLSAVRAFVFNAVLAERVRDGTWNTLLPGDLAMFSGSNSFFAVAELAPDLVARCERLEIHPSGPLPGVDQGAAAQSGLSESRRLADFTAWIDGLAALGVQAARRPLRTPVSGLRGSLTEGTLTLSFELPPGAYATAVLRELVNGVDAGDHDAPGD